MTTHWYSTINNLPRQMEQVQATLVEMRAQMATQMTQFMEVITNVNRRQDELDAIVINQRCYPGDGGNQGLYQDVSVGLGDVQDQPAGIFTGYWETLLCAM